MYNNKSVFSVYKIGVNGGLSKIGQAETGNDVVAAIGRELEKDELFIVGSGKTEAERLNDAKSRSVYSV